MSVKVVCSDMHFGDKECSLYSEKISRALWEHWAGLGKIDEMILAGDILDANLSSLTMAIEGKKSHAAWPRQIGFQGWLDKMFDIGGVSVNSIVYIPGNHDYVIFDFLATQKAFIEPLSEGQPIMEGLPITRGVFEKPFIRGVAPPEMRDRFFVVYPDHDFKTCGQNVLVTHGHYLDDKQALFRGLKNWIEGAGGNEKEAVRKFFIASAQYQALARTAAYKKEHREIIEGVYKPVDRFLSSLEKAFDYIGKLRNCPIDNHILAAIEMYVRYLRKPDTKVPAVFIFGHTHEAGRASTWDRRVPLSKRVVQEEIKVINVGSFLKNSKTAGSYLVINDQAEKDSCFTLYEINNKGVIKEMKP